MYSLRYSQLVVVIVLKQLRDLISITPLDSSSLGHSMVESMMVKLDTAMIRLIVSEVNLRIHLLLCWLPLSHVPSSENPSDQDRWETHDESSKEQPRLSVSLQNIPVTDSLCVIRQIEMVLRPQLDELIRYTTGSDRRGQGTSEQTITRVPRHIDPVSVTHTSLYTGTTSRVTRHRDRPIKVRASVSAKYSGRKLEHSTRKSLSSDVLCDSHGDVERKLKAIHWKNL